MKITIAGTGYVGLSNAVLLAQYNEVTAVDIIEEKVNMINNKKSPIIDREIEDFLENRELHLTATTDAKSAYSDADFIIISVTASKKCVWNLYLLPGILSIRYFSTHFFLFCFSRTSSGSWSDHGKYLSNLSGASL